MLIVFCKTYLVEEILWNSKKYNSANKCFEENSISSFHFALTVMNFPTKLSFTCLYFIEVFLSSNLTASVVLQESWRWQWDSAHI